MDQFILIPILILTTLTLHPLPLQAKPISHIIVEGSVYCNPCFNNGIPRHIYFMPGVDVHIQCRINVNSPRTAEVITFSVNRTTNQKGVFDVEIPYVDGVDCVEGPPVQFFCQANLIRSSSPACNIPDVHTTTYYVSVESKRENICIYSFSGMSFRPMVRNDTLCWNNGT